MTGVVKKYPYKDVTGMHWPDANAGDDIYYAIDLTCLNEIDAETITSVDWVLPNEITSSDNYLNSDVTEAHVKLSTAIPGIYRIHAEINSIDAGKESKNRIRIILKVI